MVIKHLKLGLLITATLIILAFSCNKDNGTKPCVGNAYSFAVTSEWSPQRSVYHIGDTIYLTSSFPKNLTDLVGNYNVDYSNSTGIGGNITTSLMDTITNKIVDALSSFDVVAFKGTITPIANIPNSGVNIRFVEESNYTFKAGLVLKKKGLFQFAVTKLSSNGLNGKNCTNAAFDMTVTNSNKNINLFQYALGYMPDALLQKSIYCFRVQ